MEPTWILVADSARARLFRVDRPRGPLAEHSDYTNPADRLREQDLETDAPGRGGHYAMGGDTGTKAHYADRFAKQIADVLRKGRAGGKFARLYVLAAPNFLAAPRDGSAYGQLRGGELCQGRRPRAARRDPWTPPVSSMRRLPDPGWRCAAGAFYPCPDRWFPLIEPWRRGSCRSGAWFPL